MTFELAAHNWMRPEPLEVTLQRLSRLGYSGIEIMAEPTRYDPAEVRPLGLRNRRKTSTYPTGEVRIPLEYRRQRRHRRIHQLTS